MTVAASSHPTSRRTVRALGAAVVVVLVAGIIAAAVHDEPFGGGGGTGEAGGSGGTEVLSGGVDRDSALDPDRLGGGTGGDGPTSDGAPGPEAAREPGFLAVTVEPEGECDRPCSERTTIWVVREDGSSRVQVTSPRSSYDRFPRWAPDGSALAFTRVDPETGAGEVMAMPVEDVGLGEPRAVTRTGELHEGEGCRGDRMFARWAPDGRRLAVTCVAAGGGSTVLVAAADGARQFEVAGDGRFSESSPAWSPDGRTLAFSRLDTRRRYGMADRRQLWTATVGTTEIRDAEALVAGPLAADHPRFSPRGDRLLYVATDERTLAAGLRLLTVDGEPAGEVYAAGPRPLTRLYAAEWSPDGSKVVFPVGDGLSTSVLHVAEVDGDARAVPVESSLAFSPAWSADGRRVAFDLVRRADGGDRHDVATLDPAGGTPQPVPVPGAYAYDPSFKP